MNTLSSKNSDYRWNDDRRVEVLKELLLLGLGIKNSAEGEVALCHCGWRERINWRDPNFALKHQCKLIKRD